MIFFKVSALSEAPTSENILAISKRVLESLQADPGSHLSYQGGVVFPKVDFHSSTEPEWLKEARAEGTDHRISQALLETKFKIDENGGESKTGAAIMTTRGFGGPKSYLLNEPFVVVTIDKLHPKTILNATIVNLDAFTKKQ